MFVQIPLLNDNYCNIINNWIEDNKTRCLLMYDNDIGLSIAFKYVIVGQSASNIVLKTCWSTIERYRERQSGGWKSEIQ